jgi:hypothetical protein
MLNQLGCAINQYIADEEDSLMYGRFNGNFLNDDHPSLPQLTIHWEDSDKMKNLSVDIDESVNQIAGINITKIDRQNYDYNDLEDDRNLSRLNRERLLQSKRDKLVAVSKELDIPLDMVQDVLHESRHAIYKETAQGRSKRARKARKFFTLEESVPREIPIEDLSNHATRLES